MSIHEHASPSEASTTPPDALELDKETVKDLEAPADGPHGAAKTREPTDGCVTAFCITALVCPWPAEHYTA